MERSDPEEVVSQSDKEVTAKIHIQAVLEALFVTLLWSSSWIIIKFGLQEIPPLTFAGMRYVIASIILMVVLFSKRETMRQTLDCKDERLWLKVLLYGIVFITLTQGAQFVALSILEAITVSMFLNLTPILVLFIGIAVLREIPTRGQTALVLLCVIGVLMYFWPPVLTENQGIGIVIVIIGVLANAVSSVLGREINRVRIMPPIAVTAFGMLPGGLLLLLGASLVEPMMIPSPIGMLCIAWLAIVNTAFAFTIWNRTLRTLRAVDSNVINSMMLPQIILLSIVFLGERPEIVDYIALALIILSVLLLQMSQAKRLHQLEHETD